MHVTDAAWTAWRIEERSAAHVPGARGPRAGGVVRRVWRYPAHWREPSSDTLEAPTAHPERPPARYTRRGASPSAWNGATSAR